MGARRKAVLCITEVNPYLDQPAEIALETLALCNAACTFCPYPTLDRKGEKMPDALIDKVIDEMGEFKIPFHFSPFKVNEPLLDKRFFSICQKVEKTLAHLRIFTNGSPLTQRRIDEIASLEKVTHLWISLNSHVKEVYEPLMSLSFDLTVKRLDNLHAQDFPHPVVLSRVGVDREFRSYCKGRWPKFKSVLIAKSSWLGFTEADEQIVPDTSCGRWTELSILSSGIVSLCCMDGEGKFPIGDINKQTLLEVYNSPYWRERRELNMSRRDVEICKTCTYRR